MPRISIDFEGFDIEKLSELFLFAHREIEGLWTGIHPSVRKGSGIEYKQHRPYVVGDDHRKIDWKTYAKSDRLYVREHQEETNRSWTILLDCSGSMGYGRGKQPSKTKHEYACELAACISYLLIRQGDSVGLLTFGGEENTVLRARSGHGQLGMLLDRLENSRVGSVSSLERVFSRTITQLREATFLIMISDCFYEIDDLLSGMARIQHSRHEAAVVQILHPDELSFPFRSVTRFESLEDGDSICTDAGLLRSQYHRALERFKQEVEQVCQRFGVDLVCASIDRSYSNVLIDFLYERGKRRA